MRSLVTHRPGLANFDRWFDNVLDDWARPLTGSRPPAVDVRQDEHGYHLEAELPGRTEKDFEVKIEHNLLTISSAQDDSTEQTEDGFVVRERRSRSFSRSFVLPKDVEADKISASFSNGLLALDIPKAAAAKPKLIEVKTRS